MTDPPAGAFGTAFPAARVLLMGTGSHVPGSGLPEVPAVAGSLAAVRAVLVERSGVAEAAVRVVLDPATAQVMGEAVAEAADGAGDLLLVYYVGHGLVSPDGALHLAACQTEGFRLGRRVSRVEVTGLPYAHLRNLVRESEARSRVVILDCCFSGRALDGLADAGDEVANLTQVTGGYVLTSAGGEEVAFAPAGQPYTAFTGALVRLLRDGDPHAPQWLTLHHAYRHLAAALPAAGFARPRQRSDGRVGELVLAMNPGYRPRTPQPDPVVPVVDPALIGVCPYKGLAAYEEHDEAWFHGRQKLVSRLVERLADRLDDPRVLVVTGASGSGKSSLVRAGLLPALSRGALGVPGSSSWPRSVTVPTADPTAMLTGVLDRLTPAGADDLQRAVLIVDQFEEVFTLCEDEAQRRTFIQTLTTVAGETTTLVVLVVRADFYGRCTTYPELGTALEGQQIVVPAMTAPQTRQAVEEPGRSVGLTVEPGLVDLLLADLGVREAREPTDGAGAYEPGRLPLLSHALRETWRHREADTLTVAAYRRTGGIRGALAATAEQVLGRFDAAGQEIARRLLLGLVRIGDSADDTRRRMRRDELLAQTGQPTVAEAVLDAFAGDDARLVTRNDTTVEITHDALLHAWPRLREWIDNDRAGLLVQQDLLDAARQWRTNGHDPSLLYTGTRLAVVREWAAASGRQADLSADAVAFLHTSTRQTRRRTRRARSLATVLVVLLLGMTAAGVTAAAQQQRADASRVVADAQHRSATSRSLTIQAELLRTAQPMTAMRLGIAAMTISPDPQSRASLVTTIAGHRYLGSLPDEDGFASTMASSADGRTLATVGDDTVILWDIAQHGTSGRVGTVPDQTAATSMAFSPDGLVLAIAQADEDSTTQLWNVTDRAAPVRLATINGPARDQDQDGDQGPSDATHTVAFSPDGRTLAGAFGSVTYVWDVTNPAAPRRSAALTHDSPETVVAFSPNGTLLAVGAELWNVTSRASLRRVGVLPETDEVVALSFSPDSTTLAVGERASVHLWDVTRPSGPTELTTFTAHLEFVNAVAFSPNARMIATGGTDNTAALWDLSILPPRRVAVLSHSAWVTGVAFSPDGKSVATMSDGDPVRFWSTAERGAPQRIATLPGLGGPPGDIKFSPDGHLLAASNEENGAALWDVTDRAAPRRAATLDTGGKAVFGIAFSPDGHLLATGGSDHNAVLWNIAEPTKPRPLATLHHDGAIDGVAFSPDGHLLATGSDDNTATLWDVTDPTAPRRTAVMTTDDFVDSVAFKPDGRTLAVSVTNGTTALWNVSEPAAPKRTAPLTGAVGVRGVTFSPDGHTLATASDDYTAALWDTSQPGKVRRTAVLAGHTNYVWSVVFSPDGRILATGGNDSTVAFWDVTDRTGPRRIMTMTFEFLAARVDFSHDGRAIATLTEGDTAGIWNIEPLVAAAADPLREACRIVGRGLDADEWSSYLPGVPYQSTCP